MSAAPKQEPTCKYCGSINVSADAAVRFDKVKGDWEVSAVFDGGSCDDCEETMKYFVWKDIVP